MMAIGEQGGVGRLTIQSEHNMRRAHKYEGKLSWER